MKTKIINNLIPVCNHELCRKPVEDLDIWLIESGKDNYHKEEIKSHEDKYSIHKVYKYSFNGAIEERNTDKSDDYMRLLDNPSDWKTHSEFWCSEDCKKEDDYLFDMGFEMAKELKAEKELKELERLNTV
jgi:hypothetical protein